MCINQFYPIQPNFYFSLQLLTTAFPIVVFMVYCSHKQEKLKIARKLKLEQIEQRKAKQLAQFKIQKAKIKQDREVLSKKKDVSDKVFENPHGQKFTPGEIKKILDREEQV